MINAILTLILALTLSCPTASGSHKEASESKKQTQHDASLSDKPATLTHKMLEQIQIQIAQSLNESAVLQAKNRKPPLLAEISTELQSDWWVMETTTHKVFDILRANGTTAESSILLRKVDRDDNLIHTCYEYLHVPLSHQEAGASYLDKLRKFTKKNKGIIDKFGSSTNADSNLNSNGSNDTSYTHTKAADDDHQGPDRADDVLSIVLRSGTFCYPSIIVTGMRKCSTSAMYRFLAALPRTVKVSTHTHAQPQPHNNTHTDTHTHTHTQTRRPSTKKTASSSASPNPSSNTSTHSPRSSTSARSWSTAAWTCEAT